MVQLLASFLLFGGGRGDPAMCMAVRCAESASSPSPSHFCTAWRLHVPTIVMLHAGGGVRVDGCVSMVAHRIVGACRQLSTATVMCPQEETSLLQPFHEFLEFRLRLIRLLLAGSVVSRCARRESRPGCEPDAVHCLWREAEAVSLFSLCSLC